MFFVVAALVEAIFNRLGFWSVRSRLCGQLKEERQREGGRARTKEWQYLYAYRSFSCCLVRLFIVRRLHTMCWRRESRFLNFFKPNVHLNGWIFLVNFVQHSQKHSGKHWPVRRSWISQRRTTERVVFSISISFGAALPWEQKEPAENAADCAVDDEKVENRQNRNESFQ